MTAAASNIKYNYTHKPAIASPLKGAHASPIRSPLKVVDTNVLGMGGAAAGAGLKERTRSIGNKFLQGMAAVDAAPPAHGSPQRLKRDENRHPLVRSSPLKLKKDESVHPDEPTKAFDQRGISKQHAEHSNHKTTAAFGSPQRPKRKATEDPKVDHGAAAAAVAAPADPAPERTLRLRVDSLVLQKYFVIRPNYNAFGEGTNATVFPGFEISYISNGLTQPKTDVAIKVSEKKPASYALVKREAAVLKRVEGVPHVPQLRHHGDWQSGEYALVLDVLGKTLYQAYLKNEDATGMPLCDLQIFVKRALELLQGLSQKGVILGGMKTSDIFHEEDTTAFCGFDKAHLHEEPRSYDFQSVNSRAPELLMQVDDGSQTMASLAPSDVWSLGCLLFRLYTTQELFPRSESLNARLHVIAKEAGVFSDQMIVTSCETARALFKNTSGKYEFVTAIPPTAVQNWQLRMMAACVKRQDNATVATHLIKLMEGMLVSDPAKRVTAQGALGAAFLTAKISNPLSYLFFGAANLSRVSSLVKRTVANPYHTPIASGGFGSVVSSVQLVQNKGVAFQELVAMKLFRGPKAKERAAFEANFYTNVVRGVKHVVPLQYAFENAPDEAVLGFPLLKADLARAYGLRQPGKTGMPMADLKTMSQQLLVSLSGFKAKNVAHADLKPENLVFDAEARDLKLFDLGAAIQLDKPVSNVQFTFSYRPPESIFFQGFAKKDELGREFIAMDMWSCGCTLFEVYTGFRLFQFTHPKETTPFIVANDLVHLMVGQFGMPSVEFLQRLFQVNTATVSRYFKKNEGAQASFTLATPPSAGFAGFEKTPWKERMEKARLLKGDSSEEVAKLVNLIELMLTWEGAKRITPELGLEHALFNVAAPAAAAAAPAPAAASASASSS